MLQKVIKDIRKKVTSLTALGNKGSRFVKLLVSVVVFLFSFMVALLLRTGEFNWPTNNQMTFAIMSLVAFLLLSNLFELHANLRRYFDLYQIKQLFIFYACYASVTLILVLVIKLDTVPRSLPAIQAAFLLCLELFLWFRFSEVFGDYKQGPIAKRFLLVGVGGSAIRCCSWLDLSEECQVVGFADPEKSFLGRKLLGKQILSMETATTEVILNQLSSVIICDDLEGRSDVKSAMKFFSAAGLEVLLSSELVAVDAKKFAQKNNENPDLLKILSRDHWTPLIQPSFGDVESVLITGSGGSIGSEIARQVINCKPAKVILIDNSELSLFELSNELKKSINPPGSDVKIEFVLADVSNKKFIKRVINKYKPEIIFHAAAYKHVNMLEKNPDAAFLNNYVGSKNVALCGGESGCRKFILISSDKAVNPTSVMGGSKKMAESAIASVSKKFPLTHFSVVRFGNVLGSSGSVVPIFRRQIREGGPVTLTDPDATRFFMSIPEAVSLVLKAQEITKGDEVFVLDMGKPIKILDLAKAMIKMAGFEPLMYEEEGDGIRIKVIGLRKGEKLHEELSRAGKLLPTKVPQIMIDPEGVVDLDIEMVEKAILEKIGSKDDLLIANIMAKHGYLTEVNQT